jgi:hypothetical protein
MRMIASTIAAVLLVAGCSSNDESSPSPAPTSQPPATSAPTPEPSSATPPPVEETPGLAASEVLAAFMTAKLPVRHARNNSKNCETQQLGCLEMVTTDDVTITTWGDSVAMETYAQAFGTEAFVLRNVVLQYAAAKTPATMRPKYQAALTKLAP